MMPRHTAILGSLAFLAAPGLMPAQQNPPQTERSGARQYVDRIVEPGAVARSGAAAGLDQALTNPYEWGGGITGFARRFGSAFGTHVVRSSIHFGVSKVLHEELDYRRSDQTGFGRRLKYALVSTV